MLGFAARFEQGFQEPTGKPQHVPAPPCDVQADRHDAQAPLLGFASFAALGQHVLPWLHGRMAAVYGACSFHSRCAFQADGEFRLALTLYRTDLRKKMLS